MTHNPPLLEHLDPTSATILDPEHPSEPNVEEAKVHIDPSSSSFHLQATVLEALSGWYSWVVEVKSSESAKMSANDNAMTRFLFAILQQKCLKDVRIQSFLGYPTWY